MAIDLQSRALAAEEAVLRGEVTSTDSVESRFIELESMFSLELGFNY